MREKNSNPVIGFLLILLLVLVLDAAFGSRLVRNFVRAIKENPECEVK
jgi:hypothetical protein